MPRWSMQACNLTTGGAMTELHLPYRPQAVSAHREAIESRRPIFSQLVTLGDDNSLLHMDLMFEPKHWIDRRIVGVLFRIREASFEGIDALGLAMLGASPLAAAPSRSESMPSRLRSRQA